MYFHLILFSYILSLMLLKKRSFPHGHGAHNVCSSATPVFNFLTWKTFPSKETEKQPFSVCREEHDPRPMSLFLPFTWPPLCTYTLPSTPSFLVCCVICGLCGSLFYMCWLLRLALTLLWPVREQLTNSTVYSRCCWLSYTVSPFVGFFLFTFLFCWVAALFLASCCSSTSTVFVLPWCSGLLGQSSLW